MRALSSARRSACLVAARIAVTIEAVVIEIEASVVTATTEAPGAVAMVQGVPPVALAPPSRQRPQQRPQPQFASVVRGGARSSGQPADVERRGCIFYDFYRLAWHCCPVLREPFAECISQRATREREQPGTMCVRAKRCLDCGGVVAFAVLYSHCLAACCQGHSTVTFRSNTRLPGRPTCGRVPC